MKPGIYKEKMRSASGGEMIYYPIKSIHIENDSKMTLTCRDAAKLKDAKTVLTGLVTFAPSEPIALEYQITYKDGKEFLQISVKGNIKQALSDFSEMRLISQELQTEISHTAVSSSKFVF